MTREEYYSALESSDYFEHHGIKGQKWGIRRYQNEDGTYTEEGKKRYFDSDGKLNAEGRKFMAKQAAKEAANLASYGNNEKAVLEYAKAEKLVGGRAANKLMDSNFGKQKLAYYGYGAGMALTTIGLAAATGYLYYMLPIVGLMGTVGGVASVNSSKKDFNNALAYRHWEESEKGKNNG